MESLHTKMIPRCGPPSERQGRVCFRPREDPTLQTDQFAGSGKQREEMQDEAGKNLSITNLSVVYAYTIV
jgi:hypothetical protein